MPVDLNLCGFSSTYDEPEYPEVSSDDHEMAEIAKVHEKKRLGSAEGIQQNGDSTEENTGQRSKNALTTSVRTQAPQSAAMVDGKLEDTEENLADEEECVGGHCPKKREKKQQITSTVKTQDRGNCVLDMAIVMENDIGAVDEAIKQFKREVEEGSIVLNDKNMDGVQRTLSGRLRTHRVKNNASYELAQQFEIDERNFRLNRARKENANDNEQTPKSPRSGFGGRRRVLNNASYELAQQCDYIKAVHPSKGAFQRMDACDELEEHAASKRFPRLRVTDMVQQMSSSSTSNLNSHEPYQDTKTYSKSTENIFSQFSKGPFTRVPINELGDRLKKQEDDSILSQVKKKLGSIFSLWKRS